MATQHSVAMPPRHALSPERVQEKAGSKFNIMQGLIAMAQNHIKPGDERRLPDVRQRMKLTKERSYAIFGLKITNPKTSLFSAELTFPGGVYNPDSAWPSGANRRNVPYAGMKGVHHKKWQFLARRVPRFACQTVRCIPGTPIDKQSVAPLEVATFLRCTP